MAFDDNQKDYPVPTGDNSQKRESAELLPKYFRTPVNQKFLHSTLDQLISPGTVEKINVFYGSKTTPAYKNTDLYLPEVSNDRDNYKFEPAIVQKDSIGNINFYNDYVDYVNIIKSLGGTVENHSVTNAQEIYAWSPKINWDKFVNYREYFWLPYGASTVSVIGQQRNLTSTYSVTKSDQGDNYAYIFTPDGATPNPTLKLYRGQKYIFNIDSQGLPFTIKTKRDLSDDFNFQDSVSAQKIEKGQIVLEIKDTAPDILYYGASNDINSYGLIQIYNIEENSVIDVEKEVIGKKTYTLSNGVSLSNGMKVDFKGTVTPEKYAEGEYYVEGVGTAIQLIKVQDLEVVSVYTESVDVPFDTQNFDTVGFGTATSYALNKDYVVINRASPDRNPWARHNRWVHKSVIEDSATANGTLPDYDQTSRAKRPIIEFEAGIKLFNYGTFSKGTIDLIDTVTKDIMSDIEGSTGYFVDGVELTNGMKVLFTADEDPLYNNKIYEIKFIDFTKNNKTTRQISLVRTDSSDSLENETVLVSNGSKNQGRIFFYDGTTWKRAQEKTSVNQQPLFELYDNNGFSFADNTVYMNSGFLGNKIFSYKIGEGSDDEELGFPITYKNVSNVGDIVFNFDLVQDSFAYQSNLEQVTKSTEVSFLRIYKNRTDFDVSSAWKKSDEDSFQRIVRFFDKTENLLNNFPVDCVDNSANIQDINVKVFVNGIVKVENQDYALNRIDNVLYITFNNDVEVDDSVVLKVKTDSLKNNLGYYEAPKNLVNNPLNENISEFTLGQVTDHVKDIITELPDFQGDVVGANNLRDLGDISPYGKKFVQHSGPIGLSAYLLGRKDINILKAIDFSQEQYPRFKRSFLKTLDTLGFESVPREVVDRVLQKMNFDKKDQGAFFQSDMVGSGAKRVTEHEVLDLDSPFFAISESFDLTKLSKKAIYVYYEDEILTHGTDYVFQDSFVKVTKTIELYKKITVVEYETTNGNYIPATPTKLGLYPKYEPKKYLDRTAINPIEVIQGHDGSLTVAYGDFRDDIILELEKRIYNNIKVSYNDSLFDYKDLIPSKHRENKFSFSSINKTLLRSFNKWHTFVGNQDYITNTFYDSQNSLTWNYTEMNDDQGEQLLGFWRGVYKYHYDTDRPNITPWEMLGYTEEPSWWQTVYGPPPYTGDNLILWKDLENGAVKEPGKKTIILDKYKRPGLTAHIPVDSDGNILSPFKSGLAKNFVADLTKNKFKFGDHSPVENAWRRSSDYPFAILKSFLILQPSKIIGVGWDISRTTRDSADQIIYNGKARISQKDLIFPSRSQDDTETLTAGLVNFLYEFVENNLLTSYSDYQKEIKSIGTQLGFKIRGYSNKDKFKLVLDSKTPLNSTTLFVPEENYSLFKNKSQPIDVLTYSALVIEKQAGGYSIRGYDREYPYITYLPAIELAKDPLITVGGVSASYVNWTENKRYDAGSYVKYQNEYYAVETTHISDTIFDASQFIKLVDLPIEGGVQAFLRKEFQQTPVEVAYGTVFDSIQKVVDVILGYGAYLQSKGFDFNEYNDQLELVANWQLSTREFLFWTTQNWDEGSVIALSPASKRIKLKSQSSVADNIFNNYYTSGVLKEDGNKLDKNFLRIVRQGNDFEVFTKNTANGIYLIKIPLVQIEHVCLLDNVTQFNDLIFDPASGAKQERIKVIGYITEWDGSQTIPGFVFDDAIVSEWAPYTDYPMSAVVKYKQFYYTAKTKLKGTETFENASWRRLSDKPSSKLLSNFEYKTNQFSDFYDLDSDNFDASQQRQAQHLIGYQPREYLKNIINDDVSQYKFYQGMIQEKGTNNVLDKMFKSLASADKESLEFFEEWAIRKGQYGATDVFDEYEYKLDETKFRLNPQPILLTDQTSNVETDLVYRIQSGQTYLSPENYDHRPFPIKYEKTSFLKTAGPVNPIDIDVTLASYDDILTYTKIDSLKDGSYIWLGKYNNSWNVLRYSNTEQKLKSIVKQGNSIVITTLTNAEMNVGEIFVANAEGKNYVFKCESVSLNTITCEDKEGFADVDPAEGFIRRFTDSRITTIDQINNRIENQGLKDGEKFWVEESNDGKWKIVNNKFVYKTHAEISNPTDSNDTSFGTVVSSNKNNTTMIVSQPDEGDGKLYVFTRPSESAQFRLFQTIDAPTSDPLLSNLDLFDANSNFGRGVAISPNGNFVLVGAPEASKLRTEYKGNYDNTKDYEVGDIVRFKNQLWKATNFIQGQTLANEFSTFDSSAFYKEATNAVTSNLVIGDVSFRNDIPSVNTDHILIRASKEQYNGTKVGDKLVMRYVGLNTVNPPIPGQVPLPVEPFNGVASPIFETNIFNLSEIQIQSKVDEILFVETSLFDVQIGDLVHSDTGSGTVTYRRKVGLKQIIYLENVSGVFTPSAELYKNSVLIGTYSREIEEDYDYLGGWWKVPVGGSVPTSAFRDQTNNLVIVDIIRNPEDLNPPRNQNIFYTSTETAWFPFTPTTPVIASQFTINSYTERFYIDPSTNSWTSGPDTLKTSNDWMLRAPPTLSFSYAPLGIQAGDTINVWINNIDNGKFEFDDLNIDSTVTNKSHVVKDVYAGYVDIDSQPDNNTNFYFPQITPGGPAITVRDDATGATADVAKLQFIGLQKIRLWLKNATAPFTLGSNAGQIGSVTMLGTPNRLLGSIEQTVMNDDLTQGPYLVFEHTSAVTTGSAVTEYFANNIEYWFWTEILNVPGVASQSNIPNSSNLDWTLVHNIPIGEGTKSTFISEGAFLIYKKDSNGEFKYDSAFTVPDAKENLRLGSDIQIKEVGEKTVAYIKASGNIENTNPGRLYFIEYSANKNWWISTDPQYMGVFDNTAPYLTDEKVYFANQIYKALTNISAGNGDPISNSADWAVQDEHLDFVGYIPNDTNLVIENDSTLNQNNLIQFADTFDVNANGTVIALTVKYSNDDQRVIIYKLESNHYVYKQTISAPADSSPMINFGSSVSISDDGELIAIGSPLKDLTQIDMGVVYVYKKSQNGSGAYELNQTLSSPSRETSENFGHTISFSGDILAVTSLKGDIEVKTTIDGGNTTFDSDMTTFTKVLVDSGSLHVYQKFEDTLLYGEKFVYADTSLQRFGTNLLVNNNHVYVGLPELTLNNSNTGTVIDFRKSPDENNWTSLHESSEGIDQPDLSKIKSVFLYNRKTNKVLTTLDYLDPIVGKIPGPAEEEIFYKTSYDPAVYNNSSAEGNVDETNYWTSEQIGRLWWNIDDAQYYYPYQSNIIFNNSYWNKLFVGADISVYEWVESKYTPTQWNNLSEKPEAETLQITGTVDNVNNFVTREKYDSVSQTKTSYYYYWVKNKKTLPKLETRNLSAFDVAQLIKDPRSQGYKYVTIFGSNKFSLVNCDSYLENQDVVISFRIFNQHSNNNVHNEYALMSEGNESSTPPLDIEKVWFNSLIGYDEQFNQVPDPTLSEKLKYGTLSYPRQSWFVNNKEALKQVIERINSVLIKNLIVDEFDVSNLSLIDTAPSESSGLYDTVVDTQPELQFISTGNTKPALLRPTITDGKIVSVSITQPGKGYSIAPTYKIKTTTGEGAVIRLSIDSVGSVNSATVVAQGRNYSQNDSIEVRKYSALVSSDSTVDGKWAIYSYDVNDGWLKSKIQSYNVGLYWQYNDWYAQGYTQFTEIDHRVSQSYELGGLQDNIGDIVKIDTVGTGGWLLLEKIDNQADVDYTVNYKTIGRQNGTIQFKNNLYNYEATSYGFDSNSYDVRLYDIQPIQEVRIILETIKDKVFIETLKVEYNKLFFSSLKYALAENKLVDFAFKTSFVRSNHNVGELKQKVTFKNDNLSNYEDYINEVKPYKTKVREYVSVYEKTEPTNTGVTDFDLPPAYNNQNQIEPPKVKLDGNQFDGTDTITTYPDKHWLDNVGFKVKEITIGNPGTLYTNAPNITITGGGGSGATAKAFIKNGSISKITVTNEGSGYISSPSVTISGSTTGTQATASAVLGDSVIRSSHIGVKFDRTSGDVLIANLNRTETFIGNNSKLKFNLKWPVHLGSSVTVTINGVKQLRSAFSFNNETDTSKTYTRQTGYILFTEPPINLASIVVNYKIDQSVLSTQDKIANGLYQPTDGMAGSELAQLVDGIDYGGVEVRSFGFENTSGWDNTGYNSTGWDIYDVSYEDEVFYLNASTQTVTLSKPLENGVQYNVYKQLADSSRPNPNPFVRQDDPNFGTGNAVTNTDAVMQSLTGDGVTTQVDIQALATQAGDTVTIRKITSDGSYLPDPDSVDSLIQGGDVAYSSAKGIDAEEINIDGDGFVTETSSKGPEEFVPGQVLDTLDIQVYDRGANTGSKINSYNYIGNGVTKQFAFEDYPQSNEAVFVTVNNVLLDSSQYVVDFENKKIVFNQAPVDNDKINFITMGNNGESILDSDRFLGDGSTVEFVTRAPYTTQLSSFVKVNGVDQSYTLIKTDNTYAFPNRVAVRFNQAPSEDSVINITIYESNSQSFSEVTKNVFTGDGSTTNYQLNPTPFEQKPFTTNTVVKVDNKLLRSDYTAQFTITQSREYEMEQWQVLPGTVGPADARAFLNDVELQSGEWRWNTANSSATLESGIGQPGDKLEVFVAIGEYKVDDTGVLSLSNAPSINSTITAYQFSKHDILDIDRYTYEVIDKIGILANSLDYFKFNQLKSGKIKLRTPAVDVQYVWVSVNGELLAPNIDYTISNDQNYVLINVSINPNDVIDIVHLTAPSFIGKFAYRQFKDLMNKTHFKRIGNEKRYFLAEELNWYDKQISLTDAGGITQPNINTRTPGIIYINKERIEYFIIEGNVLKQLRRGTFGTGIKQIYPANTEVVDQSQFQSVPYKDEFITEKFAGIDLTQISNWTMNNEQGNPINYIKDSLVIHNNSIWIAQSESVITSNNVVVHIHEPGVIDEVYGTSWRLVSDVTDHTSYIINPEFTLTKPTFGQKQDTFEIFVAGRRLRKNAISVFDATLAQDSPEGDKTAPAQIVLDGSTNRIIINIGSNQPFSDNTEVLIVRKQGKIWQTGDNPLSQSENDIARFIREKEVTLPQ